MIEVLIFLATVAGMEVFAYVMHRGVMHGPGWFLHASHHRARTGPFEWNDLYAVIFAVPSIVLIALGVGHGWGSAATAVGAGIAGYGAIYFGFHDWIAIVGCRTGSYRVSPISSASSRRTGCTTWSKASTVLSASAFSMRRRSMY